MREKGKRVWFIRFLCLAATYRGAAAGLKEAALFLVERVCITLARGRPGRKHCSRNVLFKVPHCSVRKVYQKL